MLVLTSLIWAIHNFNNDNSLPQTNTSTTTATPSTSDMNNTIIAHITQRKINDYGSIITSIVLIVSYIIEHIEFYNAHHSYSDHSAHNDTTLLPANFIHFLYTQIYSVNTTSSPSPLYIGRQLSLICSTLAYTSLALSKLIPRMLPYILNILQSYIINNEVTSVYIMSDIEYISAIFLPRIVLVTSVGGMCYHLTLIAFTSTTTTTADTISVENEGFKKVYKTDSINSSTSSSGDDKKNSLIAYIMYMICLLCLLTTQLTHVIILTLSLLIACHFWFIISTITSLERIPLASYSSFIQHDTTYNSLKSTTTTTTTTTNDNNNNVMLSHSKHDNSHFPRSGICISTLHDYDIVGIKRWVCKHVYDTICTSVLSLPSHDATTTSKIVRENRDETNKQFNNDNKERDQRGSNNTRSSVYQLKLQVIIVTAVYLFIWGRFIYFATDHRHIISKLQVSYYPLIYCFLCIYTCMYCYCITYNI